MNHDNHFLLKLISVLLIYPDKEFIDWLPSLESEFKGKMNGSDTKKIYGFVAGIQRMSPLRLQEHYTQLFDINPGTCLNMTYHSTGDTEERGRTLAQMDQVYLKAGFERTSGELPDYLPLVLEFLAQCPKAEGIDLLWDQMNGVKKIASNFHNPDSPYRLLFEILAELVKLEIKSRPPPMGEGQGGG